ncbi:MAG: DNA polymerase III subunit delta [Thermoanaerobaculia bacterium]
MPRAAAPRPSRPSFDEAPSVILVAGDVDFFVEEEARKVLEHLAGENTEVLHFDEDASPEAVSDALLNRSLFSPRRIVQLDVSRLLGTSSPGNLFEQALEGWERGGPAGRKQAYRTVRGLLSALGTSAGGNPEELADAVGKRLKRREGIEVLAEILRELPEEKGGGLAILPAVRALLQKSRPNDGVVALLTATAPPAGAGLAAEIERQGLFVPATVGSDAAAALSRFARQRAKDRDVAIDPDAMDRLRESTDGKPELFASELGRLIQWAGPGGRIRAGDVGESVEDEASEDLYKLYDAIGKRDAADALRRIERIFDGRDVRTGDSYLEVDEYILPQVVLGRITDELRSMLLVRARLEHEGLAQSDALRNVSAFRSRVMPLLSETVEPFGRSPFRGSPFRWFYVAQRGSRYSAEELARALSRAGDVDVKLKNSAPAVETLTEYVASLIAGKP